MSDGAARTYVSRLRDRFRALVREEIAETIGSAAIDDEIDKKIDDEIRYLWSVLTPDRRTLPPLP
jgi:hypothetical protein